ncbi:hypothetical protein PYW08_012996 [Mythimna loreyi]|uniref:Uncharacterized protein n=1 Tax=Mythimna loreyi TaxID=667449 RepID=A0ACC2PYZ3_9NEOP|nr:hypothetical protein PYW08_012996 [Mythimna loreyi]
MILEQKELSRNIELVHVQKLDGENVTEIVKKIAEELKLNTEDIEKAWRVPTRGGDGKNPRPIIVTLRTKEARSKWLKTRKETKITNHNVYQNHDFSQIYINEHLTHQMRNLFWATKTNLKDIYKFIWIQNSKILIKKEGTDKKVHQIRFESDIQCYIAENKE